MKDQFEKDMNRDRHNIDERIKKESNERETGRDNDPMRRDTTPMGRDTTPMGRDTDRMGRDTDPMNRDTDQDKVVAGIFENEDEVTNVIRQLREIGYREDEITVVAKDMDQLEHVDDTTNVDAKSQQSGGGKVGAGAAVGGTLGGIAAALPFLGLVAIPGVGPLLAAGPIAGILGGVVAGGVAGGLVGGLIQLGVREEDAKGYEQQIEQGKILVLVENREDMHDDVQNTFRQYSSGTDRDRSRER